VRAVGLQLWTVMREGSSLMVRGPAVLSVSAVVCGLVAVSMDGLLVLVVCGFVGHTSTVPYRTIHETARDNLKS
jgi:hypothetical protein